jgi:taurine dioxygenase
MTMTAKPLCVALGVEISGIDLAAPLGDAEARWLREQYDSHHLLLLRGHSVTAEQQATFAQLFGRIALRERTTVQGERADTQHVSNVRSDGLFGSSELFFHVDQLFEDAPLGALILYAIEVPEEGGDTLFSNGSLAWESMPAELKARIEHRQCRHAYTYAGTLADDWNMKRADKDAPAAVHPMVWTDPRSGLRNLWANKAATVGVVGLDEEAGLALIDEARTYLDNPDFVYRHHWRPHDLLLWNNRLLHHARTPFDPAKPRTLRRSPIL